MDDDTVSGLGILWDGLRTTLERGATLVVLFLFLGVTGFLAWHAAGGYGFELQLAVAALTTLVIAGGEVIAVNTLVDSSTKVEMSSMYLTEYKGIVWTTVTYLLSILVYSTVLVAASAPFWYLFLDGAGGPIIRTLLADPHAVTVTQWYALTIQVQSVLLTVYIAARLMTFPGFVAVENDSFLTALRKSWAAAAGHVHNLVLPVLVAATSIPVAFVAGWLVRPVLLAQTATFTVAEYSIGTHPYVVQTVSGGTIALFTAVGLVFALAIVSTAYSRVK